MKRLLAILFLTMIFCPAWAQLNNTGNGIQTYQVITYPSKNALVVVNNQQQGKCNPPQGYIGRPINMLNGMQFNHPARVIHPGEMVTMDYTPDRLNIIVDQNGIIRDMHCG
jgi:hypothetical protein